MSEKKIQTMRLTVFLGLKKLTWSNWDAPKYDDSGRLAERVNKDPAIDDWQPHAVMFDYVFDHGDKVLAKKKLLEAADRILNIKVRELGSAAERVHWELGTYEEGKDVSYPVADKVVVVNAKRYQAMEDALKRIAAMDPGEYETEVGCAHPTMMDCSTCMEMQDIALEALEV